MMNPGEILKFWFQELEPRQWFLKDLSLDEMIRSRFSEFHLKASRCEFYLWRESIQGRLAEIIILDQFSRNLFRDQAKAFSQDPLALGLAQVAIETGEQSQLTVSQRAFLYMPFMHSESLEIHEIAVKLFSEPGMESNYDFDLKHQAILKRFGRFPHRNQILGRASTPEEVEFLKQPGSSF
jgi:uncharacterized protein (DUF924 family)